MGARGADLGHLPPAKVAALIAGLPTSFADARQQLVYDVARAGAAPSAAPRSVCGGVDLIGHKGLTDLTVLIGYFTAISMTLMAYDVPSNAVGLER